MNADGQWVIYDTATNTVKITSLAGTVEMNLALALENYDGVESVDFATVWNQGHTVTERSGDTTTNFIAWVIEVTQK